MKRYYKIIFAIVALLGCTQMVRVDADNYIQNKALYNGNHILIVSTLEDVLDNYEIFQGMNVEITGTITHFEELDSPKWFLTLEKDGKKINAYEDYPLHGVPKDVVFLARWAKREGNGVTARGKVKKWGIELDLLAYKDLIVNTNRASAT